MSIEDLGQISDVDEIICGEIAGQSSIKTNESDDCQRANGYDSTADQIAYGAMRPHKAFVSRCSALYSVFANMCRGEHVFFRDD